MAVSYAAWHKDTSLIVKLHDPFSYFAFIVDKTYGASGGFLNKPLTAFYPDQRDAYFSLFIVLGFRCTEF